MIVCCIIWDVWIMCIAQIIISGFVWYGWPIISNGLSFFVFSYFGLRSKVTNKFMIIWDGLWWSKSMLGADFESICAFGVWSITAGRWLIESVNSGSWLIVTETLGDYKETSDWGHIQSGTGMTVLFNVLRITDSEFIARNIIWLNQTLVNG